MFEYFLLLAGVTVVSISLSIHYMHKSGHDIYDDHKLAH